MLLAFAEFPDELKALEEKKVFQGKRVRLVSPSPKVQSEAIKMGIPVLSSRMYFGRASHERIVLAKQDFYGTLKAATGDIADSFGVREAYSSAYFFILRHFVTHLMSLAELVANVLDQIGPEEVCAVRLSQRHYSDTMGPGWRARDGGYHVFSYERYGGDIVERLCRARGIPCRVWTLELRPSKVHWMKAAAPVLSRLLSRIIIWRLMRVASQMKKVGRKIILASSPAYRLNELISGFLRSSPDWASFMLVGSGQHNIIARAWPLLSGVSPREDTAISGWFNLLSLRVSNSDPLYEQTSSGFFSRIREALMRSEDVWKYRGVDIADFVLERTDKYLRNFLGEIHRSVAALNDILEAVKPDVVVSQMSLGPTAALGELAKVKAIPSLLISHGSHVPVKNRYEEIVWQNHAEQLLLTNYSHIALQTPWAEKFLKQVHHYKVRGIYKTGPLLLSSLNGAPPRSQSLRREFSLKGEKVILHASTPKTRSGPRMYVYETEEEYIRNLADLVEAVEAVGGYSLVVRFRPTPSLSLEDLERLLPESARVHIRGDGSFQDYLAASDILVSYSSTTIEEALLSRKAVIQYDPTGRYCHIPAAVFDPETCQPGAVYFVDRKERLAPMLQWALANHFPNQKDVWFEDHAFKAEETIGLRQLIDELCSGTRSRRAVWDS